MHVRRFVLTVLGFGLLISAVGCSADTTPAPTDTGSSKSKDKKGTEPSDEESPDKSSDPKSPATDKSPTDPPKTSKKSDGSQCKDSADCESDFCVFKAGGALGMCTKTCDGNIDCNLGEKCVQLGDAPQKACVPD